MSVRLTSGPICCALWLAACVAPVQPPVNEGESPGSATADPVLDTSTIETGGTMSDSDDPTQPPDPGCVSSGGTYELVDVAAKLSGEGPGDEAAFSIAPAGDTNGDGLADVLVGSSDGPGAYVVLGSATPRSDSLASADARLLSETDGDGAGFSVARAGDMDGDGFGDVLVGAIRARTNAGAVYLVRGPMSGDVPLATAASRLYGEAEGDGASLVSGLGDVDGDGDPDFAVGAEYSDAAAIDAGVVYVLLGPPPAGASSLTAAPVRLLGENTGDRVGQVYDAGDTDGDGLHDVLVAAQEFGDGGMVYLVRPPLAIGDASLADADARLIGDAIGGLAGHDAAGLGDIDHDGRDDIAIGDPYEAAKGGAVRIFTREVVGDVVTSSSDVAVLAEHRGDRAGFSVASAGDVDADGELDLLVGAKFEDSGANNAGAAYVLLGPLQGTVDLADHDLKLIGEDASDLAGRVAGPGDLDGDGFDDLLIGAKQQGEAGNNAGAAYLLLCGPL